MFRSNGTLVPNAHNIVTKDNVNEIDPINKNSVLIEAILENNAHLVLKVLTIEGVNVNYHNGRNNALLLTSSSDESLACLLLDAALAIGIDLDACNPNDETALMLSILNDYKYLGMKLLQHGANIHIVNKYGNNALLIASADRSPYIVNKLVEMGADVNYYNVKNTDSSLINACMVKQRDIAMYLIDNGADINYVTSNGDNALSWSISHSTEQFANELIRRGAKGNEKALIKACRNRFTALALTIHDQGVRLSEYNEFLDGLLLRRMYRTLLMIWKRNTEGCPLNVLPMNLIIH